MDSYGALLNVYSYLEYLVSVYIVFVIHNIYTIFTLNICDNKNKETKGDGIVSTEEEAQPTIGEHIAFAIGHLADLICKHSYIISNITMMVIMIVVELSIFSSQYFVLLINFPPKKN